MVKVNWKYRIILGFIYGGIYSIMLSILNILEHQSAGVITFQAIFFGVMMAITTPWISQKFIRKFSPGLEQKVQSYLTKNETIIFKDAANLARKMEGVGGMIFITDQRIIFLPHPYNIQRTPAFIKLKDVNQVSRRKILSPNNNALRIATSSTNYDVILSHPNEFMQQLQKIA